ncbi:hypothetical protein [Neobacillus sp. 19]
MKWYVKTAPKTGTGTFEDPYRPDMSGYHIQQRRVGRLCKNVKMTM